MQKTINVPVLKGENATKYLVRAESEQDSQRWVQYGHEPIRDKHKEFRSKK